jgi:hypothetical protein
MGFGFGNKEEKVVVSDEQYDNAIKYFNSFTETLTIPTDLDKIEVAKKKYSEALTHVVYLIKYYANIDDDTKNREWESKQDRFGKTQQSLNGKSIDIRMANIKEEKEESEKSFDDRIKGSEKSITSARTRLKKLKASAKKKEAWFVGKEEDLRDELFKVSGLADLSVSELKEMMSKL